MSPFLRRALAVLNILYIFGLSSLAKRICKCMPWDPCYPKIHEWKHLSSRLAYPLIANQRPLGAVCYMNSTEFNESQCTLATTSINDPVFRAKLSNAAQYINFEAIVEGNITRDCLFNGPVSGGSCFQGRVPLHSVNATNAMDIQEAVRFAARHNLRLVVRNSGHELMGRSMGIGALEVFTHNLQKIEFLDNYVPEGAPTDTTGEYALTMGSGVSWNTAYSQADLHNRSLPGGLSPHGTVGAAGGWVLGGGHSALSRYYGLGVDNVIEIKVVLPNATYATVNKYQDPDLFWAMRGGGGPTFGIVVEITMRTHPNPPYTVLFWDAQANSTETYTNLFEQWNTYNNVLNDAGWSGVMPFFNNTIYLAMMAQGNPPTEPNATSIMNQFLGDVRQVPGVTILQDQTVSYGFSFTARAAGPPYSITSSWLLPRNLTSPENARPLAEIYANMSGGTQYMVGGGPVSTNDPLEVSITPAWRTISTDLVLLPRDALLSTITMERIQDIRKDAHQQMEIFRQLAPPPIGGQYLNEPDYYEMNWQEAYWGFNYPRLLEIKKRIDPHDLLIVRMGVNSEAWDDEIICKSVSNIL